MRLAVIADIHGNILALDAVLANIDRRGVRDILNLGDVVSGPLRPRDCAERIVARRIPTVRGNHDRWVAEGGAGKSDAFALERLDPAQAAWLGALPPLLEPAPGVLAFHARPDDDNTYLMEEVAGAGYCPPPATPSRRGSAQRPRACCCAGTAIWRG
jgi:hypothetical protein